MTDLQQRLDELRQRIQNLAERNEREDISGDVSQVERAARELLSDSKNTPQESAAQALFAEIARLNSPVSAASAAIRGLLRRARIRIEIAGDDDDIDEAIDSLAEAWAFTPDDEETISLLQSAAEQPPQAGQRVGDLFNRYNINRPTTTARPD
jgi:hypothetical protein